MKRPYTQEIVYGLLLERRNAQWPVGGPVWKKLGWMTYDELCEAQYRLDGWEPRSRKAIITAVGKLVRKGLVERAVDAFGYVRIKREAVT